MSDIPIDERVSVLVLRLFAMLTARLEDGTEIAVSGQVGGQEGTQIREVAGRLIEVGQEIIAVAEALELLFAAPGS